MTDSLTMAPCQVHDAGAHALSDEVSRLMRVVHALKTTIAGQELGTFTSHLHRFVDDLTAVLPELTTIAQPDPSLPTPEKDR
jgi:hypothetical protein